MSKDEFRVEELIEVDMKDKLEELSRLRETIETYHKAYRQYKITNKTGNTLKYAAISCTHIGSLYERIDALNAFYQLLKEEGIDTIFHCGDIIDGFKMYPRQIFEQYAIGWKAQIDAFIEKVPRVEGINTYFITGNHDDSYKKSAGVVTGEIMSDRRSDWIFLGEGYGNLVFTTESGNKWRVSLVHPDGGTAYAISYKTQKYIEALSGGQKPNMVLMGHFHKAEHLPMYRNVSILQVGTFQSQTPFMRGKNLAAHVGGWIIEVVVGSPESLTNRIKAEFIPFYEPEEEEYGYKKEA